MKNLPDAHRLIPNDQLVFGETPFDDLNREELLRLVQAYHSMFIDATMAVYLAKYQAESSGPQPIKPGSPLWRLLVKTATLRALTTQGCVSEQFKTDTFFDYADDLLYPNHGDVMWGVNPDGSITKPGLEGSRPLTWNDLKPTRSRTKTKVME